MVVLSYHVCVPTSSPSPLSVDGRRSDNNTPSSSSTSTNVCAKLDLCLQHSGNSFYCVEKRARGIFRLPRVLLSVHVLRASRYFITCVCVCVCFADYRFAPTRGETLRDRSRERDDVRILHNNNVLTMKRILSRCLRQRAVTEFRATTAHHLRSPVQPCKAHQVNAVPSCAAFHSYRGENEFFKECNTDTTDPQRRRYSFIHDPNYMYLSLDQEMPEDTLFEIFKNKETGLLSMGKFLAALRNTGLRKNDPRLREMMEILKRVQKSTSADGASIDTQKLNLETFRSIISQNIGLISRAFRHQFIIPEFQTFSKDIEEIYWICKNNSNGKVASYIPQLARMDPNHWGVSICTVDGQKYSIGDTHVPFTLQSCSKPLTYAIALDQLGADLVHGYVGQEPSGRNFNELILDHNKKPHNPMINAGAILICALLKTLVKPDMTLAEKFDFTMNYFERMAGGEGMGFNNAVFLSEREAADRNYALGFYMREHRCYPEKTSFRESMDLYFQCCSMEASCDIVSTMAATLANGGICPMTEEKVLSSESVRDVLSLMHSCGMYDYSGQFAFKVGLPAKSGVCGGLMVVIPNVMGICTWSPPLDPLGNSCRGVQFCEELVKKFNFHRYDNTAHATHKIDPRRHRFETKGLNIVNLLFCAASGDIAALRRHKLSGMDMTLSDYDGRTALHLAAAEGHLDCVEFLLTLCGVPHNVRDRWGNSPMEEATAFGHQHVVDLLNSWAEEQQRSPTPAAAQTSRGEGGNLTGEGDNPIPPHAA